MTTSFSEFLSLESNEKKSRLSELSKEEAIKQAKSSCLNFLKANEKPTIIRGTNYFGESFGVGDPKTKLRRSANTSNEYNLIISNFDNWKDFPSREYSFVCTNFPNREVADNYGTSYIVIPFNNARIGVASRNDLWDSFKYMSRKFGEMGINDVYNLPDFNDYLSFLFENAEIEIKQDNFRNFSRQLKLFDSKIKSIVKKDTFSEYGFHEKDQKFLRNVVANYSNFGWFLADIFDPYKNKFELTNEKEVSKYDSGLRRELWTDSKCLFMKVENYTDMAKEYKQFKEEVLR